MKKIISFLLLVFMLFAIMPTCAFAEDASDPIEDTDELINIATEGIGYSSSQKNSLWTPPKSINDGLDASKDWHGWECAYPEVQNGSNTQNGFSGEYCGIKFLNHKYYEISEIKMNTSLHAMCGNQNVKYTVSFLVEGEWVEVASFHDSDTKPRNYDSYEQAMENDTSNYHIPADISITLDKPITTNNVRITISEYGKNYPGGDVLIFPYIYEVELIGKLGKTPDVELPEGAELSTNISYSSTVTASSSKKLKYPYLAVDKDLKTGWAPNTASKGEYIMVAFPEEHTVDKIITNFGEYNGNNVPEIYKFDIEAFDGEKFIKISEGASFDEDAKTLVVEHTIPSVKTDKVRLVFTEQSTKIPELFEFEVHISDSKTYFLNDRIDSFKKISLSKGNLAVMGEAYAQRNFLPYSETVYINDGRKYDSAYVWFPGTIDFPVYCGVKLDNEYTINKVALYVQTPEKEGTDIMKFQIQALVDGEYVTVANGRSYNEMTKYMTVYEFEPVKTDDIRIVFTAGGGTIANVKELEVYAEEGVHPMFKGISQLEQPPVAPNKALSAQQLDESMAEKEENKINILSINVSCIMISTVCVSVFKKKDENINEVENGKR